MEITQEKQSCEISAHVTVRPVSQSSFKWHKSCEIVLPLDKACSFWIDGKIINAKKGDIVFINPHYIHSFIIKETDTSIGLIIFNVKAVLSHSVKFTPLKRHITAEEIDAIKGLREKLDTLLKYAIEERKTARIEDNPLLQSIVSAYYLLLKRHFQAEDEGPPKKQLADFYKIVDYVNDNFKEEINIKAISKNLYMSREKVSEVFFKYSGIRLNDYIEKLRINNVNNMILDGFPITDAAHGSGFSSIRTFNNTYKKVMGFSPSEYVRMTKKDIL